MIETLFLQYNRVTVVQILCRVSLAPYTHQFPPTKLITLCIMLLFLLVVLKFHTAGKVLGYQIERELYTLLTRSCATFVIVLSHYCNCVVTLLYVQQQLTSLVKWLCSRVIGLRVYNMKSCHVSSELQTCASPSLVRPLPTTVVTV